MEEKVKYKVTNHRGRVSKQKLTKTEAAALRTQGYVVDEVDIWTPAPNRAELRNRGLRNRRMAPLKRRSRTGKGSIFTHFEQHYRGGGQTTGKKQVHRFPQSMLEGDAKDVV